MDCIVNKCRRMESSMKEIEQDMDELKKILGIAMREHTKTILSKEISELDKRLKIVSL